MKKTYFFLLLISLFACGGSQSPAPANTAPFSLEDYSLNPGLLPLQSGMRLSLKQQRVQNKEGFWSFPGLVKINLSKSQENEVNLLWEVFELYQLEEKAPEETITGAAVSSGSLNLSNIKKGKKLSLSAFWPEAELYLSQNTALWLPVEALARVLEGQKVRLDLGLSTNSFLGPLESSPWIYLGLKTQKHLPLDPEKTGSPQDLGLIRQDLSCDLLINGQKKSFPCALIGNQWVNLKVLLTHENPLIVSLELLSQYQGTKLAFHPLALAKPLVDYQIKEIDF